MNPFSSVLKHVGGPAHDQSVHRSNFGRGKVLVPNYVSLVGSAVIRPLDELETVDVLVRDDPAAPKFWNRSVQSLLQQVFDPQKTGKRLNIIMNPYGPHDGYSLPMLDLVLRPSDGSVRLTKAAGMAQAFASIVAEEESADFSDELVSVPFEPVSKADEKRYTFSVVYKPSTADLIVPDAHREIITPDQLQAAQWQYVRKSIYRGNNKVYVQHGVTALGWRPAGEWVDVVTWPYAYDAQFVTQGGNVRTSHIPAGSTHMGVVWEPWCWNQLIKTHRLNGFSFSGMSKRFYFDQAQRQ